MTSRACNCRFDAILHVYSGFSLILLFYKTTIVTEITTIVFMKYWLRLVTYPVFVFISVSPSTHPLHLLHHRVLSSPAFLPPILSLSIPVVRNSLRITNIVWRNQERRFSPIKWSSSPHYHDWSSPLIIWSPTFSLLYYPPSVRLFRSSSHFPSSATQYYII